MSNKEINTTKQNIVNGWEYLTDIRPDHIHNEQKLQDLY